MLPEASEAIAFLLDAADALHDARVNGVDNAWDMVEFGEGGKSSWQIELLKGAIEIVVGATIGEVAGKVIGPLVKEFAGATNEILEKSLEELVDNVVSEATRSAIASVLSDQRGAGVPSSEAFFVGTKAAVAVTGVEEKAYYRAAAGRLAAQADGVRAIRRLGSSMLAQIGSAESAQIRRSLVEWMNLLAQHDTGRDADHGGSDLGQAGSGRWFWDELRGKDPRGVLHIYLSCEMPRGTFRPSGASISGITEEMLTALSSGGAKAKDLGLPVFVVVSVDGTSTTGTPETGTLEIGVNEQKDGTFRVMGLGGERLVQALGGERATIVRVRSLTADKPLSELGVRVE